MKEEINSENTPKTPSLAQSHNEPATKANTPAKVNNTPLIFGPPIALQSLPIWFSVKFTYLVDVHKFKNEDLPITLKGKNGENFIIHQSSEKVGNNPTVKLLAIKSIKKIELSARRHKEFTDKLAKGERVNRLNDTPKILTTLTEYVEPIEREIDRLSKLTRWRFNFDCNDNNYPRAYSWSADGQIWNPMDYCPSPTMVSVKYISDLALTQKEITTELESLLQKEENEPLHHALLKEAQSILFSNPQSSFVIAVAALEVGTKYFIAKKAPQSTWLVNNLASPDIHRIFSEYIKQLEPSFTLPQTELDEVKKIINNRNTMVHAGKIEFDSARILASTTLIEKILKEIDRHLGYTWQ